MKIFNRELVSICDGVWKYAEPGLSISVQIGLGAYHGKVEVGEFTISVCRGTTQDLIEYLNGCFEFAVEVLNRKQGVAP